MEPRFHRLVALLLLFAVPLFLYSNSSLLARRYYEDAKQAPPPAPFTGGQDYMHPQPANATLGVSYIPPFPSRSRLTRPQFGAVLAVSRAVSPRRHHLLFAANLTGIDITIPDQPVWSDRHVAAFRARNSTITRGSALAWMGHLNALQWYPSSPRCH